MASTRNSVLHRGPDAVPDRKGGEDRAAPSRRRRTPLPTTRKSARRRLKDRPKSRTTNSAKRNDGRNREDRLFRYVPEPINPDQGDLIDRTIEIWRPRVGRPLTREDARQIVENVTGFFAILLEWDRERNSKPENLNP